MKTFEDYCVDLKSENSNLRIEAAEKLSLSKDNRAGEPLLGALQDSVGYVRHIAIKGLGQLRVQRAVPLLIGLIHDPNHDTVAIQALGKIGDLTAIKPLLPILENKDPYRREASAGALGQLKAREAYEPLIKLLDDIDEYGFVRSMSLSAMILIAETHDLPIELYLHKMLSDKSDMVRMLAEITLEEIEKTNE